MNMSIKKALLYGFTIAIILIFATWFIGHLWVFIILVLTAFIAIVAITIRESKKSGNDSTDDEQV